MVDIDMMKRCVLIISLFAAAFNVSAQSRQTAADSIKFESAKKQLTIFFSALNAAKMDTIFKGEPITIFAPDDQAFAKLPVGMRDSLLEPADKITFASQVTLATLLFAHIIPGKLSSKDVAKLIHKNNGQTVFTTIDSIKLTAKIDTNRNIVLTDESGNKFIVKQFDIADGNAMIFIISAVIPPKKMEFKIMWR